MDIRVQEGAFDPGIELNGFTDGQPNAGAIVSFTGVVRKVSEKMQFMQIEHYPGMTENALRSIASNAVERWSLIDVLIIHRFGDLRPAEPIMMVATAAKHRADAFAAADFLMDYLKSRAPFWKKEVSVDKSTWVSAKQTDEDALSRW